MIQSVLAPELGKVLVRSTFLETLATSSVMKAPFLGGAQPSECRSDRDYFDDTNNDFGTVSSSPEPWPPLFPDITISESIDLCENIPFASSINGELYKCRQDALAIKNGASDHEFRLMKKAGSCSVKPIGRVMMNDEKSDQVLVTGIIMNMEEPFNCTAISPHLRSDLAKQMIEMVHKLHQTHHIIHGDIKPDNMLIRRSDNHLILCDFAESRDMNDDHDLWVGASTTNYLAPSRDDTTSPTIVDDLYALGLSIWQLYSGEPPFADLDQDEILDLLEEGKTVDLSLITDAEIREIVTEYVRSGGAKV